jgi:hypothetical protein
MVVPTVLIFCHQSLGEGLLSQTSITGSLIWLAALQVSRLNLESQGSCELVEECYKLLAEVFLFPCTLLPFGKARSDGTVQCFRMKEEVFELLSVESEEVEP